MENGKEKDTNKWMSEKLKLTTWNARAISGRELEIATVLAVKNIKVGVITET